MGIGVIGALIGFMIGVIYLILRYGVIAVIKLIKGSPKNDDNNAEDQ